MSPGSGHVACFPNSLETVRKLCLLAHRPERALSGEHHRGSSGTEPGIVLRSFGANDTTDGHEESI